VIQQLSPTSSLAESPDVSSARWAAHAARDVGLAYCNERVVLHALQEVRLRSANLGKGLLSEEVSEHCRCLASTHCTDSILHADRWSVWATLDLESRKIPLQLRRTATELPIDLSARAKLNAQRVVVLVDGWGIIFGDNLPRTEVHLALWSVVPLLQQRRTNEHSSDGEHSFLAAREKPKLRDATDTATLDVGTLARRRAAPWQRLAGAHAS